MGKDRTCTTYHAGRALLKIVELHCKRVGLSKFVHISHAAHPAALLAAEHWAGSKGAAHCLCLLEELPARYHALLSSEVSPSRCVVVRALLSLTNQDFHHVVSRQQMLAGLTGMEDPWHSLKQLQTGASGTQAHVRVAHTLQSNH